MHSKISINYEGMDLAAESILWLVAVDRAVLNVWTGLRKTADLYTITTPTPLLNKLSVRFVNKVSRVSKQLFILITQPKLANLPPLSILFSPLSPCPTNTNKLIKV
jgi:hypothetical protein